MTCTVGIDLGLTELRVAVLLADRAELVVTMPATIGLVAGEPYTGAALASCRPDQQVDRLVERLAVPDGDGVAGLAWPIVDGQAVSPVELVAWLLRAALVEVEAAHGAIEGAVLAVPLELGALERRVLRDAALAAGMPAVRLLAAPAAAALASLGDHPSRMAVLQVDDERVRATIVENADQVIDLLGHATQRFTDDPAAAVGPAVARALAAAAVPAAGLSDAVVIGAGTRDPAVMAAATAHLGALAHVARAPTATIALGAAQASQMFVDVAAVITVDVISPGLALGAGSALTTVIEAGAIAPTREVRLIARDRPDRTAVDIELWEEGTPPRPYGRYHITGLPPGAGAIAACEITVDVDRIPRIDASDLVNGGALTVTPVVEVGLSTAALAELRSRVTGWTP